MQDITKVQEWDRVELLSCWEGVLKIATRNAKNRSDKNRIAINSSLGTNVGHSNKEWKMEVLKIAFL